MFGYPMVGFITKSGKVINPSEIASEIGARYRQRYLDKLGPGATTMVMKAQAEKILGLASIIGAAENGGINGKSVDELIEDYIKRNSENTDFPFNYLKNTYTSINEYEKNDPTISALREDVKNCKARMEELKYLEESSGESEEISAELDELNERILNDLQEIRSYYDKKLC